jgi:hypothetical protein
MLCSTQHPRHSGGEEKGLQQYISRDEKIHRAKGPMKRRKIENIITTSEKLRESSL